MNKPCMMVKRYGVDTKGRLQSRVFFQLNSVGASMLDDSIRYKLKLVECDDSYVAIAPAQSGSKVSIASGCPRLQLRSVVIAQRLLEITNGRPMHLFAVKEGDELRFYLRDMVVL